MALKKTPIAAQTATAAHVGNAAPAGETAAAPAARRRTGAAKPTAAEAGDGATRQSNAKTPAKKPASTKPKPRKSASARLTTARLAPAEIEEVFRRFHAADPEPKGELDYVNAFTLLVAVVLSAQATDVGVNKATRALFALADTPAKMLALGEDQVREHIKTIGLFRGKARNVIALSQLLIERHGGEVPASREALEELPGVGRKTANVVLNIFFGQPMIAVDTHLFRLANRIPLAPGKTPLEVELGLLKVIPAGYLLHAHHWLILHGRYVCKARKPECWRCLIADICRFEPKSAA